MLGCCGVVVAVQGADWVSGYRGIWCRGIGYRVRIELGEPTPDIAWSKLGS